MKPHNEITATPRRGLGQWLLVLVDALIVALLAVLPFIMGGREAWGNWFLITVALLLGTAWSMHAAVEGCRYRVSWLELFFLTGLALVWFQTQPQSQETMQQLSSEYSRLLPMWSTVQGNAPGTEHWSTVSLTPVETRHGAWVFLAYAVIACVLFQRIRSQHEAARLLQVIGLVGVTMTVFALLQWAGSNGRFFWFYEHPFTDPSEHLKGAFTNRNHFAQFLSLSLGPLMWWLFRDLKQFLEGRSASAEPSASTSRFGQSGKSRRSSKKSGTAAGTQVDSFSRELSLPVLLLLCAVALVGLAVMLSLSRGGMIACGTVALIAVVGLWRGMRVGGAMAGIGLLGGLLFFSLLAFSDQEQLQTKLDQLISADADSIDVGGHRRAIWAADAKVIERFPLLGTGVGSHRDVYSIYMEDYPNFAMAEMTHAESSFIHVALETGLVGACCLVFALMVILMRLIVGVIRSREPLHRAMAVVVIACLAGATFHAVVDFIWYVPAIVVTSVALLVVGLRTSAVSFGSESDRGWWCPRICWLGLAGCCCYAMITAQPMLMNRIAGERHWYAALRTRLDVPDDETDGFDDLEGGDTILLDDPVRLSEEEEARQLADRMERHQRGQIAYLRKRIVQLRASLQACPNQHRVQASLAEHLLQLFEHLQSQTENRMPLNMVRDAALASDFSTAEELQTWVERACGPHVALLKLADVYARKSLAACPVQGHAYLSLMETQFLNDPLDRHHQDLIDQAMLVRGYDPRTRFLAGREAMLSGNTTTAMELWESVFHSNQHFRMNILKLVAPQVPVEFFVNNFDPNAEELKDLLSIYEVLDRDRDTLVILDRLCTVIPLEAPAIEDEDERLEEMLLAYSAARRLEDLERAVDLLVTMVDDFPLAFEPRYYLGATLVDLERPEEALPHLQWCHEHDPGNIWIPKLIMRARKLLLKDPDEDLPRLTSL